jgi:hypothetical protein
MDRIMVTLRDSVGFSWRGLMVFLLPMLPNVLFFIWKDPNVRAAATHPIWLDVIEHGSQALFAAFLIFLVSSRPSPVISRDTVMAAVLLLAYIGLWIAYFTVGASFIMLLLMAVIPVGYFILAGLWLHNLPAVLFTVIFGITHILITYLDYYPS